MGNGRVNLFIFVLVAIGGLVIFRLFNLTYIRHSELTNAAKNQYSDQSGTLTGRGSIYFNDLSLKENKIAAFNKSFLFAYSDNSKIKDPADTALRLANAVGQDDVEKIKNLLSGGKNYQVVIDGLSAVDGESVKSLNIQGLKIGSTIGRFYPQNLAAPVLGFVGYNGNLRTGQYGVEAYYDDILTGRKKTYDWFGNRTYSWFANILKFGSEKEKKSNNEAGGKDLVLTIDPNIQSFIDLTLENLLKKWSAESGMIIVQEPLSGKILAMSSSPDFDPNKYFEYDLEDFINPATQQIFEPGSSFKPITMAAAIDSESVSPDTKYNDTGEVRIGGYSLKNFDEISHGIQTMREVLQKSLNTGAIFAQEKTGDDSFLNHVVSFGFGRKSGIDLPGEVIGNISNLYDGRRINFATASFGQGIAVTPIQLINAYSAIANGGRLMKPYVVDRVVNSDGTITETSPEILDSPIKEKTSVQMKSMLIDVVEKGFDKARVRGYDIAGKTGTAQIPDKEGGYLGGDQFIHNFVGFAPAYSPRFTVLIRMDKPRGIKFAADSLSPVFGEIARYLIRYFNIPPTKS